MAGKIINPGEYWPGVEPVKSCIHEWNMLYFIPDNSVNSFAVKEIWCHTRYGGCGAKWSYGSSLIAKEVSDD